MSHYAIIGASGLIGQQLIARLLEQENALVTAVSRRMLDGLDARVNQKIVDFADSDALCTALAGIDTVFVAVGTTQKKVNGDRAAYRQVDYAIPVAVAQACVTNRIASFLLVSSVGADSQSRNFYLRIKGEVEDAIEKKPIASVSIFQPSLLLGKRQENRIGERISQRVMPLISFLLPHKYRPVSARTVAITMIRAAKVAQPGVKRFLYDDMHE